MRAGKLRHQIWLQRGHVVSGDLGQPETTWETFAKPNASVESVNGRRYFSKSGEAIEATHKIEIRYRAGVTAECRIVFGTRVFEIVFVDNVKERNRELVIIVQERVA